MNRSCATCAWFAAGFWPEDYTGPEDQTAFGECRAEPPRRRGGDTVNPAEAVWPVARSNEWCAGWHARPADSDAES